MRRSFTVGLALAVVVTATCAARADWPSLNPFASTPKKTTTYKVKDDTSSLWWPSLPSLPSWSKPAARRGPTTWQKVKAAPGNMVTKTGQVLAPLNPFATKPKKTGYYTGSKKQEPSGFWPNWMTVEEKSDVEPPKTVTDWLDAKRPGEE